MKISVVCEECGQRLEVPETLAGRRGKCPQCRTTIAIPAAEHESPSPSPDDGYGLGSQSYVSEASTFVRTAGRERSDDPDHPARTAKRPRPPRKKQQRETGVDWNAAGTRKALALSLGIVVVLAIVALFVPRMMVVVGSVLALVGVILTLYGYVTAIYIAFTEDDLHGWLVLIFPFYAAYYLVSRWDEMKSRLVMILIGLALSSAGSWMIETGRARGKPADSASAQVEAAGARSLA